MMVGWLLVIVILLGGLFWVFGRRARRRGDGPQSRDPAEDALRESYARGEIDERTYRRRLEELRRR